MELNTYGISDAGMVRVNNEDAFLLSEKLRLYAVADGMGGHKCGEIASHMAIGILQDIITRTIGCGSVVGGIDPDFSSQSNLLASAIRLANSAIYEAASERDDWRGMGTTIAAALVDGNHVGIAHVGDSRIYLLRDGSLRQITVDHSLVAEQLRKGLITSEEAELSKQKNIITRALGHEAFVDVEMNDLNVIDGDCMLICSDGLTGQLSDQEIAAIIQSRSDLQLACRDLVEQSNARGGTDNITAVLLAFHGKPGFLKGLINVFKSD